MGWSLLVAGMTAVVALVIASTGPPQSVEALIIDNRTEFALRVEVRPGDEESWLGIGSIAAGEVKTFEHVNDKGSVWVFRFSGQGETSAEHEFGREELIEDDWTLIVPPTVAEELRSSGVEPPP